MTMSVAETAIVVRGVGPKVPLDVDELKFIFSEVCSVGRCLVLPNNVGIVLIGDPSHRDAVIRRLQGTLYMGIHKLHLDSLSPEDVGAIEQMMGKEDAQARTPGMQSMATPNGCMKESRGKLNDPVDEIVAAVGSLDDGARERLIRAISSTPVTAKKPRNILLGNIQQVGIKSEPLSCTPEASRPGSSRHQDLTNVTMLVDTDSIALPKLSIFSGVTAFNGEPKPGETTYTQFNYQVRCLIRDGKISDSAIMQAVRRAVKGSAADTLLAMGEAVTPQRMLSKFEVVYGNVLTREQTLEEIYAARQREGELTAPWCSRLENLAAVAIDKGAISKQCSDEIIRSKFWTGLSNDYIKQQTRHKFDDI